MTRTNIQMIGAIRLAISSHYFLPLASVSFSCRKQYYHQQIMEMMKTQKRPPCHLQRIAHCIIQANSGSYIVVEIKTSHIYNRVGCIQIITSYIVNINCKMTTYYYYPYNTQWYGDIIITTLITLRGMALPSVTTTIY